MINSYIYEDSLYNEEDANTTSVPTPRFEKEQNSTDDDELIDEDYENGLLIISTF